MEVWSIPGEVWSIPREVWFIPRVMGPVRRGRGKLGRPNDDEFWWKGYELSFRKNGEGGAETKFGVKIVRFDTCGPICAIWPMWPKQVKRAFSCFNPQVSGLCFQNPGFKTPVSKARFQKPGFKTKVANPCFRTPVSEPKGRVKNPSEQVCGWGPRGSRKKGAREKKSAKLRIQKRCELFSCVS